MSNVNATAKSASINFFTFDHIGQKIVGSELNFKKAGIPGSNQYNALMDAMSARPTYALSPLAPKVKKQTYKGLNSDLITEYVEVFGNEAQKAELEKMIDDNEAFPAIKSWFLDYFKCGFTVEKAKREIAHRKLKAKKSKVRKVVKANMVKAEEAKAPPAVINF
jgi:hypothetical protein